jgi:hypothetical protein
MDEGAAAGADPVEFRPPRLLPVESDLVVEDLGWMPFFSSCSFFLALRSAHQMVMDWLRFSLFTRGFLRDPAADVGSSA